MRTSYPTPTFSDGYQFKLVDSTFIHAVHLARTVGTGNYCLGITFQSNEDSISWYVVKDPVATYKKLTDPKQSPGFTFNNSVKGKKFHALPVYEKPNKSYYGQTDHTEDGIDPKKFFGLSDKASAGVGKKEQANTLVEGWKARLEAWKATLNAPVKTNAKGLAIPKVDNTPLPKDPPYAGQSGYGTLLDVCQKVANSSCISYLALGYNKKDKNFVVYFTLKSQGAQNMQAFFTDDASVYRCWTSAESLGRYYNKFVKVQENIFSVRGAAKA